MPYRILLPTDVFPPRCGGAGWSAHALALALQAAGCTVTAVVPRQGPAGDVQHDAVLGVDAVRWSYAAPNIPFVKNYFRHERIWQPLAQLLVQLAQAQAPQARLVGEVEPVTAPTGARPTPLVIHAQHVQVAPAAVLAARPLGVPVVVNIRDHWPWDYFATGLHGDQLPYPRQTWASLLADLPARLGPLRGALAMPAIPYILAHVRRRQAALRQADAVIAGSRYIAQRLAPIVDPARIHIIPNSVDLSAIDRVIATPPTSVAPHEPYLLYVGKLERNKGAHLLPEILAATQRALHNSTNSPLPGGQLLPPLVIAGDGPLRASLVQEFAVRGIQVRFLDWVEHDEVLRLMEHCQALVFPSAWGEPLARTLLEASACAAPIAAMPTGGTLDIIAHNVSGVLAASPSVLGAHVAALLRDAALRRRLGATARAHALERYAPDVIARQVIGVYQVL